MIKMQVIKSVGGNPDTALASTLVELNKWATNNPGIRVINVETVKEVHIKDDMKVVDTYTPVFKGYRVWYEAAE